MNIFNKGEKVLTPDGEGKVKDIFHDGWDIDRDVSLVLVDFGSHVESYFPFDVVILREDFRCDVGQNSGQIAPNINNQFQTQNQK